MVPHVASTVKQGMGRSVCGGTGEDETGDRGEDPGIQACVPLWIFGSEIITLIDR